MKFLFYILLSQRIQSLLLNPIWNHMWIRSVGRQFDEEVIKTMPSVNPYTMYQHMYDMKWYVVGVPAGFSMSRPTKVTVWSRDYAVWKTGPSTYTALANACPHRGAALSAGDIARNGCITCPFHGNQYDDDGCLQVVEATTTSEANNAERFDVVEDGGWVYLNTFSYRKYNVSRGSLSNNLAEDAERNEMGFTCTMMQMDYAANPRIVVENGLDISHILRRYGLNHERSSDERQVAPNRYRTETVYKTGSMYSVDSVANWLFGQSHVVVESEFELPHRMVTRFKSDDVYVNTVVAFATPVSHNRTRLFVKNYRNFLRNVLGDLLTKATMLNIMNDERRILEQVYEEEKDGKFNMRYDKLANMYRVLYEKEYGQWPK